MAFGLQSMAKTKIYIYNITRDLPKIYSPQPKSKNSTTFIQSPSPVYYSTIERLGRTWHKHKTQAQREALGQSVTLN